MPSTESSLPSRHEFDETAYLLLHPDVAAAVAAGTVGSGWHHYSLHGQHEKRQWLPKPDSLHGVSQEISPRDGMLLDDRQHYFDAGESALHCIQSALFAARRRPDSVRRILDLPCGHGRVLRFLRAAFPAAEVDACDLDRDGVNFCATTFAAHPIHSRVIPREIPLAGPYDLVWCGSLLTHLPEERCQQFLEKFRNALAPGGILVVTLHGTRYADDMASGRKKWDLTDTQIAHLLAQYRQNGFGYTDYSDGNGYGFSLTHPSYTLGKLLPHPDWRVIGYAERGWDERQDVVVMLKNFA